MATPFNIKKAVILTCHSRTVTSHIDPVSSSPVTPEQPGAAEENPDRRPVVAPEAFQSSCAAPPPPSTHRNNTMTLKLQVYPEMRQTHRE